MNPALWLLNKLGIPYHWGVTQSVVSEGETGPKCTCRLLLIQPRYQESYRKQYGIYHNKRCHMFRDKVGG